MTTIKILGTGCATCKRLLSDVNEMNAKNNWQAQVEYITDIADIMSYGIVSTPALVVNETVLMTGHPGAAKVEQALKNFIATTKQAPEIDPAEALEKAKASVLFVDVREASEIAQLAYDVPNLLHIPMGELQSRYQEIPRDRDVVMVCQGGGRSLNAVYFLMERGYSNTVNMRQGILGWFEKGYPVKQGETFDANNASCCDTLEGGCGTCCSPNTSTAFIGLDQLVS